jgi:myo-inositol-1-phosphate synthase
MREPFHAYDEENNDAVDVVAVLRETEADMLVNFLPVGSHDASIHYADACLKAQCAFVNCIPEFIASDQLWAEKFEAAGIPLAGDDIKSQVGATIVHRALIETLVERGVKIDETYQLNIGGNTDFLNMTTENRLVTKRVSKTKAITSLVPYDVQTRIGPSDYVSFLKDIKIAHISIEGKNFGNLPISINLSLRVNDSPNSAGVVVDVVRATKLALDRGVSGPLVSISSYAFKHPPVKVPDDVARIWVERFIEGTRNS